MFIYEDFTNAAHIQVAFKSLTVGAQTYLYKDSVQRQFTFFIVFTVLQSDSSYLFAISHYLCGLGVSQHFYIRQVSYFVLQYLVGLQCFHKLDDHHFLADARQIDSGFDAGIATAHYSYFLSCIERTVAMRTKGYSTTNVFGFARHVQPSPSGSRCNDDRWCTEHFAPLHYHLFHLIFQNRFFYPSVFEQFYRITGQVITKIVGQFTTCSIRNGNQVLNTYCFLYLSTNPFGHHTYTETFAGQIDSSRSTSRTATQYQDIEFPFYSSLSTFTGRSKIFFQFIQQFSQ